MEQVWGTQGSVLTVNMEGDVDFFTSLRRHRTSNLSQTLWKKIQTAQARSFQAEIESQSLSEQAEDTPNEQGLA